MDDDDLSEPDRLRIQAAFLRSHPHYQWVGSNAQLIDDYGVWGFQRMPERPQAKDFLFNSPFIHPTVMVPPADTGVQRRLLHGGRGAAVRGLRAVYAAVSQGIPRL